ncbi:MAG: hypothetical protein LIO93_12700 [Bacteroidales bacterium]|nr:hypothetical protein [Bacteroidales bacterium]
MLLAAGAWLFFQYTDKNVMGWSFIILSVLCLIFGISTLFDRNPSIVLTENGITETSSIREEIEWGAILHVDDFYYRGQHFIRLLVDRNYKPDLIQPTWFYRLDRLYEQEGVKALFIRVNYLDITSMKLARFIRKMIQADGSKRTELLNSRTEEW